MRIAIVDKYRALSRLGKVFLWLSVAIALIILIIYSMEVVQALRMDPLSYNCISDSMMKQICHHPYSSSISWTLIYLIFFGWPITFPWIIIGLVLAKRRYLRSSRS
jgi:hypothetical protein